MNYYKILQAKQCGNANGLTAYERQFVEYLKKIDIKTLTGALPLYVRSRASQILQNYIIYGTASGVGVETENLWDENYENISTDLTYKSINVGNGQFTLSTNTPLGTGGSSLLLMSGQQSSGATTVNNGAYDGSPRTVTSIDGYVTLVYRVYDNKDPRDYQTMLTKGSTAPSSYIPHGYKLPLKVTSNGTTTDYPIYIGDSKLGEEEYVDYESGKVYKKSADLWDVNGMTTNQSGTPRPGNEFETLGTYVIENNSSSIFIYYREGVSIITGKQGSISAGDKLTIQTTDTLVIWITDQTMMPYISVYRKGVPTEPPVPLPDIALPQGIVTIDIEGDLKPQATVKGKIEQIT